MKRTEQAVFGLRKMMLKCYCCLALSNWMMHSKIKLFSQFPCHRRQLAQVLKIYIRGEKKNHESTKTLEQAVWAAVKSPSLIILSKHPDIIVSA